MKARWILVLLSTATSLARAQLVADSTTAVLSDITTNVSGIVAVGLNGSFTLLVLSNNCLVTNSGSLFIGQNVTARSNEVRLVSPTARWLNSSDLSIGYNGAFNRLTISNGAQVTSTLGLLSVNSTSASNNTVIVTGAGSVWSNSSDLNLGSLAGGNRMEISDGGWVGNRDGTMTFGISNRVLVTGAGSIWSNRNDLILGLVRDGSQMVVSNGGAVYSRNGYLGQLARSSNNLALVTGAGSLWSNQSDLHIGKLDKGNQVVVSNGGWVVNSNGYVGGLVSTDVAASNNAVTVTGPGSTWSNRADLIVGLAGGGNRLVVSNGATVYVDHNSAVGYLSSARSNSVIVTDPGTRWVAGEMWYSVGSNSPFNQLVVSNGAVVATRISGTLEIGAQEGGSNNLVVVTGAGSLLTNSSLFVGTRSDANRLVITNGGQVQSSQAYVGFDGLRNEAVVAGSGSLWNIKQELDVGFLGVHESRLVVSNGGTVASGGSIFVGRVATSPGRNRVIVDGGTLRVTNALATGILNVNGGTNVLNAGLIEVDRLIVTNRGSDFVPFPFGNSSSITIPNGGTASQYPSTISVAGLGGVVTKVTVTLSNLSHAYPDDLDILLVSPTGQKVMLMSDAGGGTDLSNAKFSFDDAAISALADETLAASGTYQPTDYNPGETLPSPAPAGPYSFALSAFNGNSPLGIWRLYISDDSNPESGSLQGWGLQIRTDALSFDRGVFEFNGGTLITQGAVISNAAPFVVGASGSAPALWNVRMGDSDHRISGDLVVGENSSFHQLILTNGALLTNSGVSAYGTLGQQSGARSNVVTIAGAGSRWWLDDGIIVGSFGSGNRLVVSNGASIVTSSSSSIGAEFPSTNNEAIVTGVGSSWISGVGQMFVGYGGRNNRLEVRDGGLVVSSFGTLGHLLTDSSNNLAVVTGAGSVWSNAFELSVGNVGAANRLVVSNGGSVFAANAVYLGVNSTSTSNQLTVNNGKLRVTNASVTGTLNVRRGTVTLSAGQVEVDRLLVTNSQGHFVLNGGMLSSKSTIATNGVGLHVGNSVAAATFLLAGNGTHLLTGLVVDNNATLTGNGTVGLPLGNIVVVLDGGTISPGASIGRIGFNNQLLVFGTTLMEISKNGVVRTNDQILISGGLSHNGHLTVTNIGPSALASGDRFQLFTASFSPATLFSLTLPPLGPGLSWTNKLLVDGSIEVIGVSPPEISGIMRSGTNIVISGANGTPGGNFSLVTATNVAMPASNWDVFLMDQFDGSGAFLLTNGVEPSELQRYFRIRIP